MDQAYEDELGYLEYYLLGCRGVRWGVVMFYRKWFDGRVEFDDELELDLMVDSADGSGASPISLVISSFCAPELFKTGGGRMREDDWIFTWPICQEVGALPDEMEKTGTIIS